MSSSDGKNTTGSDNNSPELRDHSFDGIQEYDNQLPAWWVYKFLITIVFAGAYLYWFQFAEFGKNLGPQYEIDRAAALEKQQAEKPTEPAATEAELRAMLKDPEVLKKGEAIFQAKCVSCHGQEGEGIVGPNLTDDFWIHGGAMVQMVTTISEGVPAKGMISWKGLMTKDEIHQVASYVKSLRGRKVKNPKAPEGNREDQ